MRPIDAYAPFEKFDADILALSRKIARNAALTFLAKETKCSVKKYPRTVPTIGYDPVVLVECKKRGRLLRTQWFHRCSLCGCSQDYAHNFCPSCGAKMDGGKNK